MNFTAFWKDNPLYTGTVLTFLFEKHGGNKSKKPNSTALINCAPTQGEIRETATNGVGRCWMEKFQSHQVPHLPQELHLPRTSQPVSFGMTVLHGEQPNGRGHKTPWGLGDTDCYPHPTQTCTAPVSSAPPGEMGRALVLQPWVALAGQCLGVPVPQQQSCCAGTAWGWMDCQESPWKAQISVPENSLQHSKG